jgi:di/tricarboxylate transporter
MVCGMTVLMAILEKTGGIELCTRFLGRLSTPRSGPFVMGLLTGALSAYSSSSGVVLPAFLPTIPGLIGKIGGGDALALADSVNVGAHLVDVSPLSTLGALCLAAAPTAEHPRLYRQLLLWGLAMIFVGAVYCFVVFGLLR